MSASSEFVDFAFKEILLDVFFDFPLDVDGKSNFAVGCAVIAPSDVVNVMPNLIAIAESFAALFRAVGERTRSKCSWSM